MANRSTRRLITDRLRQAEKYCDAANEKLAEVMAKYYESGYEHGAELEMVREALFHTANCIERFRKERA